MNKIIDREITEDCTNGMLIYGANINIARMASHELDGLKPVQLRILYACYNDKKLTPKSNSVKVQAILGVVSEKYHPHADAYGPLVAMGQPWTNNYPLIQPQGSFGTPDGFRAGAGRYIEAKLSEFCWDCYFSEFNPRVVDFIEASNKNYMIPEYLPSKYPAVLINGSFGIGYTKASSIPPHNLNEVINVTIALMLDPNKEIVLYPDSPTGCDVIGKEKFEDIVDTGRGSFKFRSTISIEEELLVKNKKETCLVVHNIPYSVNYDTSIKPKLLELMQSGEFNFIKDVLNETKGTEVKIIIVLKKGVNPYVAMEKLYKHTEFESSYKVILNTIRNFNEHSHSYKSVLLSWIKDRREMKVRLINNKIMDLSTRVLILDGLIKMLSHPKFKEIIGRIHDECKDKQSTIQFLMEYFKISDLQAERISSMQLYNLNKTHIIKYQDEKDLLEKDIKDLIALRKNPKDIDLMIISELKVAQEKYGRPRQSRVLTTEEADNIVPEIEMSIAVYKDGTVRTSEDVDRIKHYKADKLVGVIDGVSRKDDIHLFTSSGNMLRVPVEKISDNTNLKDQLGLHSNDSIVFACNINRLIENDFKYLVFITKDGLIKKSEINLYAAIKNTALMSIVLNEKDTVVQVIACRDNEPKYLLYSENGDCLIINVNTINTVGRMAKGVIGLTLEGKDKLKDIVELTKYDSHLVIITEKGHIKKVSVETLPFNDRNGKTSSLATLLKGDKINNVLPIDSSEDRELTVTTNKNTYTIPYKDIPELTRKSKCEKVFNIGSTEYVVEMY